MSYQTDNNEPVHAPTIRSRVILEIASEVVAAPDQPRHQVKVLMRDHGEDWPINLSTLSTIDSVEEVVSGRATMAFTNPSAVLTLAYLGRGPFKSPQPVRAIAVIPSLDQYMFAVKRDTGLVNFEDIGAKRFPLRIAGRAQPDHCLHIILEDVMAACGFSLADLKSWGGDLKYLLGSRSPRIPFVTSGEADALFDEAVRNWVDDAIDADMTILSFTEPTMKKLETLGYRRGFLRRKEFPRLPRDIMTIDFSGWTMFVREDAPDKLVTQICTGLDRRQHLMPWQGEGPMPVPRMCRDEEDTPLGVPLHRAAEAYWRKQGYLK